MINVLVNVNFKLFFIFLCNNTANLADGKPSVW